MSDGALVGTLLTVGGAVYLTVVFWATAVSVRESKANTPPDDHA
jgi:hypothetical protein